MLQTNYLLKTGITEFVQLVKIYISMPCKKYLNSYKAIQNNSSESVSTEYCRELRDIFSTFFKLVEIFKIIFQIFFSLRASLSGNVTRSKEPNTSFEQEHICRFFLPVLG